MKIKVKVIPNSSRNEIAGWQDDILKIKVKAPAVKGKANNELIKILAKKYNVSKSCFSIIRGHSNNHKLIELEKN